MAELPSPPSTAGAVLRVGLLGSEKKFRTFFNGFQAHCVAAAASSSSTAPRLECVPLSVDDIEAPDERAPGAAPYPASWASLDVILHKLSDDIAAARPFDLAKLVSATGASAFDASAAITDAPARGTSPKIEATPDTHASAEFPPAPEDAAAALFHTEAERRLARLTIDAVVAWERDAPGSRLVFEPPTAVALTTRRCATHAALHRALTAAPPLATELSIALPWTEVAVTPADEHDLLTAMRTARCDVLVKSDVACGKSAAHHMCLVTGASPAATPLPTPDDGTRGPNERSAPADAPPRAGMRRVLADDGFAPVAPPPFPRVVQRAVSDADVVFKVYVLGGIVTLRIIRNGIPWIPETRSSPVVAERPAVGASARVPDLTRRWFSSQASEFFPVLMESRQLPPSLCAAGAAGVPLAELPAEAVADVEAFLAAPGGDAIPGGAKRATVLHAVAVTAARLRTAMGMRMFGFDLAVGSDQSVDPRLQAPCMAPPALEPSSEAGRGVGVVHVLDVNYFPGYKGIRDVNAVVARLVADTYAAACPSR
eukprot:CAMPEP_0174846932 /NCGR_PEP_ID=MMETSP1114-20130205/12604_1 /TAXON_ID=312471 /ORGANISM="Neobodo designis, Strain CCAP 1951/1" /LENGTH=541 /DNA_ID=CAMNT_0016081203 /DNA_START=35 /DNA_END=1660 /DNA_ORIENTATION=+